MDATTMIAVLCWTYLAGFCRGLKDRVLWGYERLWLWRFRWFRRWRTTKFATIHIPWDAWHTLAGIEPVAAFLAGMYATAWLFGAEFFDIPTFVPQLDRFMLVPVQVYCAVAFWTLYATVKTKWYEWLLMRDAWASLVYFLRNSTKTPFRVDH